MYKNILLRLTKDGSHTLYLPEINEHYHSVHGAINESIHVFLNSGFSYHSSKSVSILEIGFGTGLNALLTIFRAKEEERTVIYHAVDNYPLPQYIISQLNYPELFEHTGKIWFSHIHRTAWNKDFNITSFFNLKKILADIQNLELTFKYDIVYYDAFAPGKQPEIWSEEIFLKIFNSMNPGAVLTTYSSRGEVKRKFERCGFDVEKIPGPPGKREMLRCCRI